MEIAQRQTSVARRCRDHVPVVIPRLVGASEILVVLMKKLIQAQPMNSKLMNNSDELKIRQ